MEPNIKEVAGRIRALREDIGPHIAGDGRGHGPRRRPSTPHRSPASRTCSFTFLYKCAEKSGRRRHRAAHRREPAPDGLLAHARGRRAFPSSAARASSTCTRRRISSHKLAEPFLVTAPYLEEEQDVPVHLSHHEGQELDFIISGQHALRLRGPRRGDPESGRPVVMYDSGRGHGMIATGGEPCAFLAIVMKPEGEKII